MADPARGPTTEELRARVLAQSDLPPGELAIRRALPAALLLPRPCLACNREQGERMCDLCQRLELAEARCASGSESR